MVILGGGQFLMIEVPLYGKQGHSAEHVPVSADGKSFKSLTAEGPDT